MIVSYTITETRLPAGELAIPDMPCPTCQAHTLTMHFFNLREDTFFHGITHAHANAYVHCTSCNTEIEQLSFKKPLYQFFNEHKQKYRGRFQFGFKWKFVVGCAIAFTIMAIAGVIATRDSKSSQEQHQLAKEHSLKPMVGDIVEIWERQPGEKTPQDPVGAIGSKTLQVWFKVVHVDGKRLTIQKSSQAYDHAKELKQDQNIQSLEFLPEKITIVNNQGSWQYENSDNTLSVWRVTPAKP